MYSVYVLENQNDKSWYIGFTSDLKKRIEQHNSGIGGRTTELKEKGSWKLMYAEAYCDKRDAAGREKFLKGGSGRRYLQKQLVHYLNQV
jgi:putative endonuclease